MNVATIIVPRVTWDNRHHHSCPQVLQCCWNDVGASGSHVDHAARTSNAAGLARHRRQRRIGPSRRASGLWPTGLYSLQSDLFPVLHSASGPPLSMGRNRVLVGV